MKAGCMGWNVWRRQATHRSIQVVNAWSAMVAAISDGSTGDGVLLNDQDFTCQAYLLENRFPVPGMIVRRSRLPPAR
jgi:hypothetical protein